MMMYSLRLLFSAVPRRRVCECVCVFFKEKKTASAGDLLQLFSQKLAGDFFSWGSKAIKPQKASVSG